MLKITLNKLTAELNQTLNQMENDHLTQRLWQGDPTLWTGRDEAEWLGWLKVPSEQLSELPRIHALRDDLIASGIKHIVVLGMGGSSLCPAVLADTFLEIQGFPKLHVLDSTDPRQILRLEQQIDINKTFFIVSSKSGSTLEPHLLLKHFYQKLNGNHFMVITDPGSALEEMSERCAFRSIFYGKPSIGGRYSALSNFGIVPAGLMGLDVRRLLSSAQAMAQACSPESSLKDNPGVILGSVLGTCARHHIDKVTFIISPGIESLGSWLEQLIAESTGKNEKGLIPVDQEPLGSIDAYGSDRLFVYIRLESDPDLAQDTFIASLERNGHYVVRSFLKDKMDLGGAFFQWEFATVVASHLMGVNPFNQPDVEASKTQTRQLTFQYEQTGEMPKPLPLLTQKDIQVYANRADPGLGDLASYLKAHFDTVLPNDYIVLAAFMEMSDENISLLQKVRAVLRDTKKVATCLSFGPRFLHSTGQLYKGGANTGVFLYLTVDHPQDLAISDEKSTFGVTINMQALGDFEVLSQRSRRAMRIHLSGDTLSGLSTLIDSL